MISKLKRIFLLKKKELQGIYNFKNIFKGSLIVFFLLSLLDGFDIPSKIQEILGIYNLCVIVLLVILYVIWSIRKRWEWRLVGEDDYILISICTGMFVWFIGYILRDSRVEWIYYANIFIICFLVWANWKRFKILYSSFKERSSKKKKGNLCDLKDLYDGNVQLKDSEIALIKEEDVDYDLLGRSNIIAQIESMIRWCEADKRFIIGVSGRWGSGKTTILNIVKSKFRDDENIVIIDEFKPWNFQNEISMIESLLEIILKESAVGISWIETERMKQRLTENLFESNGYWKFLRVFGIGLGRKPEEIGKVINEYLETSGKKLVFIIDDIERADPDKIFLLFNLISNLFYLNHIIYVLSYDKEQLNSIFEQRGIKTEYLKKIIQAEVSVPKVHTEKLEEIVGICLRNLMYAYNVTDFLNDIEDFRFIMKSISSICADLRDVKIFFNSVLTIQRITGNYLNPVDMLGIQIIKFGNIDLYNEIYQQGKFFVSDDTVFNKEYYIESLSEEKFNENGKRYFANLFSDKENERYIDILERLFPYVKRYKNGERLKERGYMPGEGHKDLVKHKRICNARYFELYFTEQSNDFVKINDSVKHWILKAGEKEKAENQVEFNKILALAPNESEYLIINMLQIYSDDLDELQAGNILEVLYDKALELDDTHMFMMFSARRLAAFMIGDLLEKIQKGKFDKWLDYVSIDYKKLYFINTIIASLGERSPDSEEKRIYKGRAKSLYEKFILMGVCIRENQINVYDDSIYQRSNIWAVYHMLKDNEDRDGVKDYIAYLNDILNSKNIYRFLWDMIGDSVGSAYSYSFRKKNMEPYFPYSCVDALLLEHQIIYGETEDEKYVRKVYEARDNKRFEGGEIIEKTEKRLIL